MCLVMKVENTRRSLGTISGRDSIDEVACKGRTHPVSAVVQVTKQFLRFVEPLKLGYTIP